MKIKSSTFSQFHQHFTSSCCANTVWHTTNAIYWFSVEKMVTLAHFFYKIKLFVVIRIATAYNEQDVTIRKQL
jgi:hypothetical protein